MEKINQFQFYRIGQALKELESIASVEQPLKDKWVEIWLASSWLELLLDGSLVTLVVSRHATEALFAQLRAVVPKQEDRNWPVIPADDAVLEGWRVATIKNNLHEFETVFAAEVQTMPSYVVPKRGIYDTDDLIGRAERYFDEDIRRVIPDGAIKDFREAGRCLAFGLWTASAYHVMRCTEAVLRKWYSHHHKHVAAMPHGDDDAPAMAVCINELRAHGGNAKVCGILDQIRDLHRNDVMHPGDFMSEKGGKALFDVAKSAISSMSDEIIAIEKGIPATALLPMAVAATP